MNKVKKITILGVVATLTSSLLMTNIALAEEASNAILSEEITTESSDSAPLQSSSESKLDDDGQMKEAESDSATDARSTGSIESIDTWMPDKALQAVIARKLNTTVSAITKESMLRLSKELDLSYAGITDISGLEYAKNIYRVDLDNNIGLDESSLQNTFSKMPSVTMIGVRDCQVKNID